VNKCAERLQYHWTILICKQISCSKPNEPNKFYALQISAFQAAQWQQMLGHEPAVLAPEHLALALLSEYGTNGYRKNGGAGTLPWAIHDPMLTCAELGSDQVAGTCCTCKNERD